MAPYEAMFPYVRDLQVDSFDWSFAQTGFPDSVLQLWQTPGFDTDLGMGVISNKNYLMRFAELVAARSPHPALRADLSHRER